MILRNVDEGISVALEALRTNKLRSFLTILGVVIGVATVMLMASIVDGVRTQIFNALNAASPNVFYVMRFFSQTPLNPDRLPYEVRIRPVLDETDAAAIEQADEIRHAGLWNQSLNRIEYQAVNRLVLFMAHRHRRSPAYGRWAVLYRSPDRLGLVTLAGTVVAPRPRRAWRG